MRTDNSPIELIIKVTGETCNIDCKYCYEKRHPTKELNIIELDVVKRIVESSKADSSTQIFLAELNFS